MRRLITLCTILLLAGILAEGYAQKVNVVKRAISPRLRTGTGYQISSGLNVTAKGMKVFLLGDTTGSGATVVTSFTWVMSSKPAGSNAVLDSTDKMASSFTADATGLFIVTCTVNGGGSDADTTFVSTYAGHSSTTPGCFCHATNSTSWAATPHAKIFKEGITGELEVDVNNRGQYGISCIKCHTVGWEDAVNNGNFGYRAKSTGFDTSWYKTFTLISAGRYYINKGDQTAWNLLTTDAKYSGMEPFANIGCESCHGPATDHKSTMDKKKIGVSLDAGVCDQCHDAPNKHRLSSYWQASNHATFATTRTVSSTSCLPCHSGTGFYKAQNVKQGGDPTKNVITAADAQKRISCAACHDPHSTNNPKQLRTVTFDSLMNGYKPGTTGGMGQLCMNCHRSRYDVKVRVTNTPPYYGYSNRHYPHYSPQADMFFGQGGYEYGQTITARTTHAFVTNSCVTCHMATRTNGSSVHSNHEMKMDSAGVDIVTACLTCHPGITKFSDVIASSDYDGDGVKKGVALEIQSLLDKVKAKLPQGATGEPVTSINDTLKVKNHPEFVRSIWNYYAVKYDWSLGSHNAKYAAKLLQLSLADLTGVEFDSENIPQEYTLSQNYPNPFNPTTEIKFSVPQSGNVNLSVYNILGSLVKTLSDGELVAGEYRVKWNGTDRNNNPVASGIYLYRMTVSSGKGDFAVTKKMMLMR